MRMGKCKNITRLLSDALDRSLTTGEWVAIRLHLPTCSGCRNYRKQIRLLRVAGDHASSLPARIMQRIGTATPANARRPACPDSVRKARMRRFVDRADVRFNTSRMFLELRTRA